MIFFFNLLLASSRINYIDSYSEISELFYYIHYLRITDISYIFLKGNSHHQNTHPFEILSGSNYFFYSLLSDISAHAVIYKPSGINHLRVITKGFCLEGEIVRINSDTMSSDKSRIKFEKIPFCS